MYSRGQAGASPDLQRVSGAEGAGDASSLLQALGVVSLLPATAAGASGGFEAPPVAMRCSTVDALDGCLAVYRERLLVSVEWPAVARAYGFAVAGQPRELIEFDRSLAAQPAVCAAREASIHIGRLHLRRMRPLRDLRWLRRYREAVEADQAHGWHLVVYAAILAAYAVPLRQGLMGYARQTLTVVARAAAAGSLTEVEALDAVERALERAVPAMETLPGFDTPFGRRELLRS